MQIYNYNMFAKREVYGVPWEQRGKGTQFFWEERFLKEVGCLSVDS